MFHINVVMAVIAMVMLLMMMMIIGLSPVSLIGGNECHYLS